MWFHVLFEQMVKWWSALSYFVCTFLHQIILFIHFHQNCCSYAQSALFGLTRQKLAACLFVQGFLLLSNRTLTLTYIKCLNWWKASLLPYWLSPQCYSYPFFIMCEYKGRRGSLGHAGHSEGGGISATGILHPNDEVIGSPGALHQWEHLFPLHLVPFGLQQLHVFI